uniref:Zinc finger, CCHC-type n=1 Tax=Tanacetum cinerariifolium TaxID=118510 RepID=A0A6L2K4R2_TANCI|nr:hypothetical protein [Tanacetum cinerariifolium]
MAAATQNTNSLTIRSENKLAHLEQPLIPLPLPVVSQAARDAYNVLFKAKNEVACLMLGSTSPDLHRALENYKDYDMIHKLKTMFEEQAKKELFEILKAFHACKQEDGQSVSSYLLKMKGYLDTLECLGYVMPNELGNNDQFIHSYNMHSMGKTIPELHAMLKLHEKGIPKKADNPTVPTIREGRIQKDKKKPQKAKGKDKRKTKLAYAPSPKILSPPKIDNPPTDSVCHHYKDGLRGSRRLKREALSLYVGNGLRTAVEDDVFCRSFDFNRSLSLNKYKGLATLDKSKTTKTETLFKDLESMRNLDSEQ